MTTFLRKRNWGDAAVVGGLGPGLIGGLLGGLVLCPPVLALVLGLGGTTLLAMLGSHPTELRVVAGLGLTLVVAWWGVLRKTKADRRQRHPGPFLLLATGAFVVVYAALAYGATPLLHEIYHVFAPRQ
jgi:Na+/H+ antiporter NhaD/arsenite permease-like protein